MSNSKCKGQKFAEFAKKVGGLPTSAMATRSMPKTKPRKPRNLTAVSAQFRKAGVMKDKRLKRQKDKDRKRLEEE